MTQVSIIGNNNKVINKKIELIKCLQRRGDALIKTNTSPSSFNYVELICREYTDNNEDLIFCHNGDRNSNSCLFLGHFNDGIV